MDQTLQTRIYFRPTATVFIENVETNEISRQKLSNMETGKIKNWIKRNVVTNEKNFPERSVNE